MENKAYVPTFLDNSFPKLLCQKQKICHWKSFITHCMLRDRQSANTSRHCIVLAQGLSIITGKNN